MEKGKLTVLLVDGVAPGEVMRAVAGGCRQDGEKETQVFAAKGNSTLFNHWGGEAEAKKVINCLVAEFGQDRVVVNPGDDVKLRDRLSTKD